MATLTKKEVIRNLTLDMISARLILLFQTYNKSNTTVIPFISSKGCKGVTLTQYSVSSNRYHKNITHWFRKIMI